MKLDIRALDLSDITYFPKEFQMQGWEKPVSLFRQYYEEQEKGIRRVTVATLDTVPAGYATLLQNDSHGPFQDQNIPVIVDFNVLEKYQRLGVGSAIFDAIEEEVKKYSKKICLGVGLHSGYGAAQRLYIKRGYIPDGSGVWFENRPLKPYAECVNNDDLVLYLSKEF